MSSDLLHRGYLKNVLHQILGEELNTLYQPIHLDTFALLQDYTRLVMNTYDQENMYVILIALPNNILEKFNSELNSYGLPNLRHAYAFKRRLHFTPIHTNTHIDYDLPSNSRVNCSIVIPIEGCKDTKMFWFDGEREETIVQTEDGNSYIDLKWLGRVKKLDQIEIYDSPMLVNTTIPHSATSRTDKSYRTVLTIRLEGNPGFNEVKNKFMQD